jgi:hypothetical protein
MLSNAISFIEQCESAPNQPVYLYYAGQTGNTARGRCFDDLTSSEPTLFANWSKANQKPNSTREVWKCPLDGMISLPFAECTAKQAAEYALVSSVASCSLNNAHGGHHLESSFTPVDSTLLATRFNDGMLTSTMKSNALGWTQPLPCTDCRPTSVKRSCVTKLKQLQLRKRRRSSETSEAGVLRSPFPLPHRAGPSPEVKPSPGSEAMLARHLRATATGISPATHAWQDPDWQARVAGPRCNLWVSTVGHASPPLAAIHLSRYLQKVRPDVIRCYSANVSFQCRNKLTTGV